MQTLKCYLKVFTLDDQVSVLVPLDGGLGHAVDFTLELDVAFLDRNNILRSTQKTGRDQNFKDGGRVDRVFRVLRSALISAFVIDFDVFDLEASLADPQEPGVKVVEVDGGAVLQPGHVGLGDAVGGAVQGDGGAFAGDFRVARGDQENGGRDHGRQS
jgi:hypothetical protein